MQRIRARARRSRAELGGALVARLIGCDVDQRGGSLRLCARLARALREARAGGSLLLHCAWCRKLQVGVEWLELDAIGSGRTRIAEQLVLQSTHGICPECYERVSREAASERTQRV